MTQLPISLTVNGARTQARVEPRTTLGDFLREDQRLTGLHLACEHGVCGSCNVYVDGALNRSCTVLAVACDQSRVTTIEAFDGDPLMARLREAFSRAHALQCGYCTPGMMMTARDIVRRFPDADESRVRKELAGNLCRCTGYDGIVRAILDVVRHCSADVRAVPVPGLDVEPPATEAVVVEASTAVDAAPARADADAASAVDFSEPIDTAGMTRVTRCFELPVPVERVWDFFCDLPRVAACMPGMEVIQADAEQLRGKMTVKAGLVRAVFDARAKVARDAARRVGVVSCRGTDRLTRSQVVCEFRHGVASLDDASGTRVDVEAAFRLNGRLAEFSRGEIVQALADQLTSQFAANVARQLSGTDAGAPAAGALRIPVGMLLRQLFSTLAASLPGRKRAVRPPTAPHSHHSPRNEEES